MQRLPRLLVLVLVCSACNESAEAPSASGPPAAVVADTEIAAVRSSLIEFLRTYAATRGDVRRLGEVVAGPELQDWVHWLGVQNSGLRFGRPGTVTIRALRAVDIRSDAAAVAVDATVTLFIGADGGRPEPSARLFQGPALLTRAGGSWAVADVYRDGRSMLDAITVLEPPIRDTAGGVDVSVESVFRFSGGTVVNVVVRNQTERAIRLDRQNSALLVSNLALQGAGLTASLAEPIPPGAAVEGALNFSAMELEQVPTLLAVRVMADRPVDVGVALPPTPFLQ